MRATARIPPIIDLSEIFKKCNAQFDSHSLYGSLSQRVLTGLKPSFSVIFTANEGYFVSNCGNIKLIFSSKEYAIVKLPVIVKRLVFGKISLLLSIKSIISAKD